MDSEKQLTKGVIQTLVKELTKNQKKLNDVLDLLEWIEPESHLESDALRITAVKGCVEVLETWVKRGLAEHVSVNDDGEEESPEARSEKQLAQWVKDRLGDTFKNLSACVSKCSDNVAQFALVGFFRLFKTCHEYASCAGKREKWSALDMKRFQLVVNALLSENSSQAARIKRFQEFTDYWDIKEALLTILAKSAKLLRNNTKSDRVNYKANLLTLLEVVNFSDAPSEQTLLCRDRADSSTYESNYQAAQKAFSDCWEHFLRVKLDTDLYKRVLLILNEKVMPHLLRPLLLTDFLINSYSIGGSISILALNGVFTLIQKYNLEYPDFYKKLYTLFQPEILHVKYRARFFYLVDIFLSSSHLPEYLVAAFAKRLSRMALTAPANALLFVFPFIGNLLIRHKGLTKMIHGRQESEVDSLQASDPYDENEPDPAKCSAVDSSLWEILTLQSHSLPQVSAAAKSFSKKLPEMEWDLGEYLELSWEDMMRVETKKKIFVNVPLTFERPKGIAHKKQDITSNLFELE